MNFLKHAPVALATLLSSIFVFLPVKAQKVPMRITEEGLFVPGTIMNINVEYMFDTGAGITVISNNLFKQIKTSLQYKGPFSGFRHDGERLDGEVYIAPEISVGNFKAKNVPVMVWAELDNYGLNAILSLQPFTKQAITIDFVKQQFIVETAETLSLKAATAEVMIIKTDNYRDMVVDIFVPLRLNDKITIDAELDSGTPSWNLVVNPAYISKLRIDSASVTSQLYKQSASGQKLFDKITVVSRISYQDIKNLEEKNKKTTFRDGLIYEALIGIGMFQKSILTIDLNHHRILVNKAG